MIEPIKNKAMKNVNKTLIGLIRVLIFIPLAYYLDLSLDSYELKLWLSNLIHGGTEEVMRESTSVAFGMIVILGAASFFVIQTLVYLFIGHNLEGKRTGIFSFIKHAVVGLFEVGIPSTPHTRENLSNIDRVLSYRDNKMSFMDNARAAEFMKGTGHVDMMISQPGLKNSQKTLSYLNNKMAFMSNDRAMDFLKNQN